MKPEEVGHHLLDLTNYGQIATFFADSAVAAYRVFFVASLINQPPSEKRADDL